MSCRCCGVCCRKPRYKRLVDGLYPQDYQNADPVTQDLDKLLYLAKSDPHRLDDVGEYITQKLRRALVRDRRGHVCVSLKIMDKLLSEVVVEHLRLLAESYLNMIHELLQSNDHFFQNLAANSFVAYAERAEESSPYHRQYDFCIDRFAAMSLLKREDEESVYHESRFAGLNGLRGVVHKIGPEGNNLWDPNHLNKIIPAYLINMQDHIITGVDIEVQTVGYESLVETAVTGLKELVTIASLSHADAILYPVLCHFDLNSVWLNGSQFATDTFVLIIRTMQPKVRYLAIQALLSHLDSKSGNQKQLKRGILEVLSSCVGVATDGSIGPSVLDVFRTLVKHLRNSIDGSQVQEQDKEFHETIVRIVGEFASVLPDYHNPDIMNLIFSYMPLEGDGNIRSIRSCNDKQSELISLLVKCLCVVAESSNPSALESTLPESLLVSMAQLMDIDRADVQLNVLYLWHKMIDHNNNKANIQMSTKWSSLVHAGLSLGNAPVRFRQQARKFLFPKLLNLAGGLFVSTEHIKAYYTLVILITLEFLSAGIKDILILSVELEEIASSSSGLTEKHKNFLHACVAGCLHIVSIVSEDDGLVTHLKSVLATRKCSHDWLLPELALKEVGVHVSTDEEPVEFHLTVTEVDDDDDDNQRNEQQQLPCFNLIEKGFIPNPSDTMRNSSTWRGEHTLSVGDHGRSFRSYSMDHSTDQETKETITFDELKEEALEAQQLEQNVEATLVPSFQEMIGNIQNSSLREDVAEILRSASPRVNVINEGTAAYDVELNFL